MTNCMSISRCGCSPSCAVFDEAWDQCHGDMTVIGGWKHYTEAINGFDLLHKWWSDVDNVWFHKSEENHDGDDPPCFGHLEGNFSSSKPDHPRLFANVELPQSFAIHVEAGDFTGVNQKWRIAWLTKDGRAMALEVRGPTSEGGNCNSFALVDITCNNALDYFDRDIPWNYGGDLQRSYTVNICVNEALQRLVVYLTSVSQDSEGNEYVEIFPHHIPYSTSVEVPDGCVSPLRCYPVWLELQKNAPGNYTFGQVNIWKTRGIQGRSLIPGLCDCIPINIDGLPRFEDEFSRDNVTMPPVHDDTGHWWNPEGVWKIVDNILQVNNDVGVSHSANCVIDFADGFTEPSEGVFVLKEWPLPIFFSVRVKGPEGGRFGLLSNIYGDSADEIWAVLKTGTSGSISLYRGNTTATSPTPLASTSISDVPFDDWNTLNLCFNGKIAVASCILSDGREREAHIPIDTDEVDMTKKVIGYLLAFSESSGNPIGDYLYDSVKVFSANNVIIVDEGYGYYGYNQIDDCPCCGALGCQENSSTSKSLNSCFWGGDDGMTYLGSSTGVDEKCKNDDTTRVSASFKVTSTSGSFQINVNGEWVKVEFDNGSGQAELTLSTGGTPQFTTSPPVDSMQTLNLCIGKGMLVGAYGTAISNTGRVGNQGDSSTISLSMDGVDEDSVRVDITHNIYDPDCENCFGAKLSNCEDESLIKCKDNKLAPAFVLDIEFETDPDAVAADPCCPFVISLLNAGFVIKSNNTSFDPCNFCWGGGGYDNCPYATNPSFYGATICMQKDETGYYVFGSLSISGTGPGGEFVGSFSGSTDYLSTVEEGPPDCTDLDGLSVDLPYWEVAGGSPVFGDHGPCGLHNIKLKASAA